MVLTTILNSPVLELGLDISWAEAGSSGFCIDFPFPEEQGATPHETCHILCSWSDALLYLP